MDLNVESLIKLHNINPSETYLALAGGYALNCPNNSYLINKYNFKGFIAPPCVNDAGLSLGIGLYAFYHKTGLNRIQFQLKHAYYGDTDNQLSTLIHDKFYAKFIQESAPLDFQQFYEDIDNFPVIWFHGAAEIGPRSLGNRSILGDPRKIHTKTIINDIKEREWWRPVAPIILDTHLCEWFNAFCPSPYMLHTFKILNDKIELIPAASHLDQSARVQTISEDVNPLLYSVIQYFHTRTGIPIICNTSLNDKEEPIINTIEEMLNFALRKKIPVVYVNGWRIKLTNYVAYPYQKPLSRKLIMEKLNEEEREEAWKQINPHNVPYDIFKTYWDSTKLRDEYDICKREDAQMIIEYVNLQSLVQA
jgi:carbamoyltransferase